MKSPYKILVYLISMLICFFVSAQTTYYSIASGNWEDNTSWSLASDGSSGAVGVGVFPGRADNVVIRNGHTITIDDKADNGSAGVSASSLGLANVGFFFGSFVTAFYQTGDIIIANGGTLSSTVHTMSSGVIAVEDGGTFSISGANPGPFSESRGLVLLGSLTVASTASFSIAGGALALGELILTGNSVAIIDSSTPSAQTIVIDNSDAILCGDGALAGTISSTPFPSLSSGASTDQVCSSFALTCAPCSSPDAPTGTFITGNTGPGGVGNSNNNELWLRADDLGLSDGAAVSSWSDVSGNSLTASSSGISTEEPSLNSGASNGLPSVNFDGDDFLNLGTPANLNFTPGVDSWTFMIVYNVPGVTPQGTFFSKATNAVRHYQYTIDDNASTSRFTAWIGGNSDVGTVVATNDWFISTSTNDASAKDSWTNETVNFAAEGIGTDADASAEVLIGARRDTGPATGTGFELTGDIAEIMMFSAELSEAQRIIVSNYLAAKYDIALSSNEVYDMDDSGNGNFDFEVAGIGQAADGSKHFDAKGSGIIRVWNVSDLDNSEFLFWGHDNSDLTTQTADAGGTIQERLSRVWRVAETGDVGTISLSFDFSSFATNPLGSNLRLLIDRDGDGFADNDVTPVAGSESSDIVTFSNVDFMDGDRFTLGNTDISRPLPVELIEFLAQSLTNSILLNWRTATEQSNDYFLVQKSLSGNEWKAIGRVSGAGTSSSEIIYDFLDPEPFEGISYYRLKQVDFDGTTAYSEVQQVDWSPVTKRISAMPNPSSDFFYIPLEEPGKEHVQLFDNSGKALTGRIELEPSRIKVDLSDSPNGIYLLKFASGEHRSIKLIKR